MRAGGDGLTIDHVAVLVNDLKAFAATLPPECESGPVEEQPTEGTREAYVTSGASRSASLLLVEPVAEGPYRHALLKRGEGLHHIGLTVPDLAAFGRRLEGSGLFLHPRSLRTQSRGALWACRPGVPFLIEVLQHESASDETSAFVTNVRLPIERPGLEIARGILGEFIAPSGDGKTRLDLTANGKCFTLALPNARS
ncbi:MAG: VOC family protein [Planctomycetota bacterium]|nr:VOC family protein [Planctomycetota bacterium]